MISDVWSELMAINTVLLLIKTEIIALLLMTSIKRYKQLTQSSTFYTKRIFEALFYCLLIYSLKLYRVIFL